MDKSEKKIEILTPNDKMYFSTEHIMKKKMLFLCNRHKKKDVELIHNTKKTWNITNNLKEWLLWKAKCSKPVD